MSDILQEIREKINRLLCDPVFFTAGLIILVAVASFGLGRQSAKTVGEERLMGDIGGAGRSPAPPAPAATSTPTNPNTPETDTFYVASKNGKVYHLPYCSGAKRINEQNKVIYKTKAEAEASGLRPAANCPGI